MPQSATPTAGPGIADRIGRPAGTGCPWWCREHDGGEHGGAFGHRLPVASVPLAAVGSSFNPEFRPASASPATVAVDQLASVGGGVARHPALVEMQVPWPEDGDGEPPLPFTFTPEEARALGEGLIRAAGILDGRR